MVAHARILLPIELLKIFCSV